MNEENCQTRNAGASVLRSLSVCLCCARVFGRVRSFVMVRLCLSSRFVCVVGTPNGQMAFSLNTCTSMAVSGHSKLLHPASMAIGLWQADGE